jgi:hypothetical protein
VNQLGKFTPNAYNIAEMSHPLRELKRAWLWGLQIKEELMIPTTPMQVYMVAKCGRFLAIQFLPNMVDILF